MDYKRGSDDQVQHNINLGDFAEQKQTWMTIWRRDRQDVTRVEKMDNQP